MKEIQNNQSIIYDKFINLDFKDEKNYLNELPREILFNIFKIYENNCCNLIKMKWHFYLNKKTILGLSLTELKYRCYKSNNDFITKINYLDPKIILLLMDCEKILSGKEDGWWIRQFIYIINSLHTEFNLLYTPLYSEVSELISKLLFKFGVFNQYFKALDNFHILYDIDEDSFQYLNKNRYNGNITINYDLNKDDLFEYDHF